MANFADRKRVVVKVGSSSLAYPETGSLNIRKSRALVETLADLKNSGKEIVFVSSGAQCVGAAKGGFLSKPKDTPSKQACAAIGQTELMKFYSDTFGNFNHTVAQLLLTRDVISNPTRRTNVINTFNRLFELSVVPIINANDVVSIKHLDFDENDTLSATVALLCSADLLVLMTDVDGLYDGDPNDPNSHFISEVNEITTEIIGYSQGSGSAVGTGGMLSKIEAAKIATEAGIDTVIIGNKDPALLYKLFESDDARCTYFKARK